MSCVKVDLLGKRFGQLLVIEEHGRDKWGQVTWLCQCACGKKKIVLSANLRKPNHTTSCGCSKVERFRDMSFKHGHTRVWYTKGKPRASREYRSWQGMKKRCLDSNHVAYHHYGGRGITICDEWVNSFETFLKDLGERPKGFTLDRIDPNGNYEPSNCRWASWQTQARNKRPKNP